MSAGQPLTAEACCTPKTQAALHAFVSKTKREREREREPMLDVLTLLLSMWFEICDKCGDVLDLYDSNGARMCTGCAEQQTVQKLVVQATRLAPDRKERSRSGSTRTAAFHPGRR